MSEEKENKKTENAVSEPNLKEADLEAKLKKTLEERDEYLNGWKRAKADLANYKKEEEERFREMVNWSNETIIREIISVLDSFDLGLISLKDSSPEKKGMTLIRLQLEDVLRKYGLERIQIKIGEPFNPMTQECITLVEEKGESGRIIEEVEKGYALHGKVIRPARVKVIK